LLAFVKPIAGGTAEVVLVRSNNETSRLLRSDNFESNPGFGSVTIELEFPVSARHECISAFQAAAE
jgi:hypothetical protein